MSGRLLTTKTQRGEDTTSQKYFARFVCVLVPLWFTPFVTPENVNIDDIHKNEALEFS
jgi:hypothetical protein